MSTSTPSWHNPDVVLQNSIHKWFLTSNLGQYMFHLCKVYKYSNGLRMKQWGHMGLSSVLHIPNHFLQLVYCFWINQQVNTFSAWLWKRHVWEMPEPWKTIPYPRYVFIQRIKLVFSCIAPHLFLIRTFIYYFKQSGSSHVVIFIFRPQSPGAAMYDFDVCQRTQTG